MLFEEEEEEVIAPKKEVTKATTTTAPRDKKPVNARPGKREFDRHSGTGRGRELPKNGSGNRNWGNVKDAKAQYEDETAAVSPTTPVEEVKEEEEPKPIVFSLAEYEAEQKAKLANLTTKTPRAVEKVEGEKIEKKEEVYFIGEGYKKKNTQGKKVQEEEEESEIVFGNVGNTVDRRVFLREHSEEYREERHEERRGNGRSFGRGNNRATKGPRVNIKNTKAFPKL